MVMTFAPHLAWYGMLIVLNSFCCAADVQHLNVLLKLYMEVPFMHRNGWVALLFIMQVMYMLAHLLC